MPGYVEKKLQKYKHTKPQNQVHKPWEPPLFIFGKTNEITTTDNSPPLTTGEKNSYSK